MPPTSLSSDRGGTDGRPHVTRRAAFLSSLPATVGFVSSARGARTRYDASRSVAGDCGVPKVGQHERRLPGSLFALESAGLARGSNRRSRDVHHITQSREFGQINLFHLGPTPRWINPGHWPRLAGAFFVRRASFHGCPDWRHLSSGQKRSRAIEARLEAWGYCDLCGQAMTRR